MPQAIDRRYWPKLSTFVILRVDSIVKVVDQFEKVFAK
jgi:hypothetical protein